MAFEDSKPWEFPDSSLFYWVVITGFLKYFLCILNTIKWFLDFFTYLYIVLKKQHKNF